MTLLTQVEACLNSRPLIPLNTDCDGQIEALTLRTFLGWKTFGSTARPIYLIQTSNCFTMMAPCTTYTLSILVEMVKGILNHTIPVKQMAQTLLKYPKGDIVMLQGDGMILTKWQLASVIEVHPGWDCIVRVAMVKTSQGT